MTLGIQPSVIRTRQNKSNFNLMDESETQIIEG